MLKINPDMIIMEITKDFYLLANPDISNGMMVINRIQHDLLVSLSTTGNIEESASRIGIDITIAKKINEAFMKIDIVSKGEFRLHKLDKPSTFHFWIHTTNTCNLACTYCHVHHDSRHMSEEVMEALASKLIAEQTLHRFKSIKLRLAGGEPMIRFFVWKPFLLRLKASLHDLGCQLQVAFLTNGTLMSQEIIDFIKSERCGISVSLDGYGEIHDKTRVYRDGGGSFKKAIENIELLKSQGLNPYIMIVVSDTNIHSLPEFTSFLCSMDLGFRYSFVQGVEVDMDYYKSQLHKSYDVIEKAIENGYGRFACTHKFLDLNVSTPWSRPCSVGYNSAAVFVDGSLHVCQMNFDEGKPIGAIFDEGDILSAVRSQVHYPELGLTEKCSDCPYKNICGSGCPMNRVDGRHRLCELFKEFIPVIYRLIGKQKLLSMTAMNR